MDRMVRLPLSVATLSLIAALLAPLALASHRAVGHPPTAAACDDTVYLSAHEREDRSLHVEPLAGTWEIHCPGCILRQRSDGALREPPAATAVLLAERLEWPSGRSAPLSATLTGQAPRAPPAG